jgi:methanogen homoisocitrate dehydrogenase
MKRVCCIHGDGVGPELMDEAIRLLDRIGGFDFVPIKAGYSSFLETGKGITAEALDEAKRADAILMSALSSPPFSITDYRSPVLMLRQELDLYANVRPCKSYPNTRSIRPDIDLVIVRENTEGLYSGQEWVEGDTAYAKRVITRRGSERIVRYAFELAKREGRKKVTVVHKANVLRKTCGLFLAVAGEVAKEYPDIAMEDVIIDAMAMRIMKQPQDFGVVVTTNLFGDILSDEAAQAVGGLGMAPSMNYGAKHAMFEPTHGSAPKYAGKSIVNPCAMLLSAAMMLDYLGDGKNAARVRDAVQKTLADGKTLTQDLGGTAKTTEMADSIIRNLG